MEQFKLKPFSSALTVPRMANVHYFEFTKAYHTVRDRHPFRELIYVDGGAVTVEADSFCGVLRDRQLLIHQSNEYHRLYCDENEAPNVIILGFECACEQLDVFAAAPHTLSSAQINLLTDIVKEGRAVFLPPYDVPNLRDMKKREVTPFGADQMLKLKLETFLIELVRSKQNADRPTATAVADSKTEEIGLYLADHYTESVSLDDLCFLFNTNRTTLCKRFKDTYGETIIQHIHRLRIRQAKRLMRKGELNLTQLSAALGFSSIHYFSKTFKQYEHRSPGEYIRSIKSKLEV